MYSFTFKEFKRFGQMKYNPDWSKGRNYFGRFMWLLSLGRNALLVLFGTILAYALLQNGQQPFKLTGTVQEGLPPFTLPPFSTTFENKTYTFGDMASQFSETIIFAPIIAILESIAIAKAFGKFYNEFYLYFILYYSYILFFLYTYFMDNYFLTIFLAKGKTIDVTQELIALGLSNFMGSFVRSIPVTGSFTRTAVNNASGVQTPLAGVLTGGLVLLALSLLTSTFYYIPKTTLSAVVISAMFYLIEVKVVFLLWKTKKLDLIPLFATFFACLFLGLEYGIVIGVGINLLFILYPSARPPVKIEEEKLPQGDVFIITPSRNLHFPAAEYLREKVMRKSKNASTIVIRGKYMSSIDATVAKNFKVLVDDLILREKTVIFWEFKENVINICMGIDKNMFKYFKDGPLEDIISGLSSSERSPDIVHSIQ